MSEELTSSKLSPGSFLPENVPPISPSDYAGLSREDRIYHALMYPRHFRMNNLDEKYFDMVRKAYNILLSAPTDLQARPLLRLLSPGMVLDTAEVTELIRITKYIYGRIDVRDIDFDRKVMRNQLLDFIQRCKIAGDRENERRAYNQLANLDNLALREAKQGTPVIPSLPDVVMVIRRAHAGVDDAIIESMPRDEEE